MKLFDSDWIYKDLAFVLAIPMVVNIYQTIVGINGDGPYYAVLICALGILWFWYLDEHSNG